MREWPTSKLLVNMLHNPMSQQWNIQNMWIHRTIFNRPMFWSRARYEPIRRVRCTPRPIKFKSFKTNDVTFVLVAVGHGLRERTPVTHLQSHRQMKLRNIWMREYCLLTFVTSYDYVASYYYAVMVPGLHFVFVYQKSWCKGFSK